MLQAVTGIDIDVADLLTVCFLPTFCHSYPGAWVPVCACVTLLAVLANVLLMMCAHYCKPPSVPEAPPFLCSGLDYLE